MALEKLEMRVDELESRVAWQEQTIETLNAAISNQTLVITRLEEQIRLLSERVRNQNTTNVEGVEAQGHEVPPHY